MNTAGWLSKLRAFALLLTACDAKQAAVKASAEPEAPSPSARSPIPSEPIRAAKRPDLASLHRAAPTRLLDPGPSPQPFDTRPLPEGIEAVRYASEGRNLKAWLHRGEPDAPVLVYLHGGFAGDPEEVHACPQFAEAGYTVLAPTYRGENGNPGSFEMLFGEVRDAASAVRYAQSLEGVDADRIVVFGHSVGAATAALLATMDDVPAVMTGGAGGMYGPIAMESFIIDYGVADPVGKEATLRTPTAMLESMRLRHHAFAGELDVGVQLGTTLAWLQSKGAKEHPLRVYDVPGDHFESLSPACAAFFELAEGRPSPVLARSADILDPAGRDPAVPLYQSAAVWGQGPFGEPAPESTSEETQRLELDGWVLELPANATTELLVPDGPKTIGFYTDDFGGALTVTRIPPEVQATYRPLHHALGAFAKVTPKAARFFFPTHDGVGAEVRGDAGGRHTYVRMYATQDASMTLVIAPADAPEIHAIVSSLQPQNE